MFGKDRGSFGPPSSHDEIYGSTDEILELADQAYSQGNHAQAAHLYLAAFDASAHIGSGAYQPAIDGLRKAWEAACFLKERALAEHVFEKLETYLTAEEVATNAETLQRLALDKLEEFGLSSEDIQEMADMVSQDFAGALREGQGLEALGAQIISNGREGKTHAGVFAWPLTPSESPEQTKDEKPARPKNMEDFHFADLVGFDSAIARMNKRGIGLSGDQQFEAFMGALAKRHGIQSLPSYESTIFRSVSREDANQFMWATARELNGSGVRMFMEETPMGYPVLCVMTSPDFKMNPAHGGFSGPGMLLLEDIDTWGEPFTASEEDDFSGPFFAQLSRGAREAVMFIRSAVENPEVAVFATCSSEVELDDFFIDLLGPVEFFDIDLPTPEERSRIWDDVCSLYPSLRVLQGEDLTRLSANLSRFDIYSAAREAVDDAFKASVEKRSFVGVTRDSLYKVIAAYQPLDSDEYHELEDYAVWALRQDLGFEDVLPAQEGNE